MTGAYAAESDRAGSAGVVAGPWYVVTPDGIEVRDAQTGAVICPASWTAEYLARRERRAGPEYLRARRELDEARAALVAWIERLEDQSYGHGLPILDTARAHLRRLDREIELAARSSADERGVTLERLRALVALARGCTREGAIEAVERWIADPAGNELPRDMPAGLRQDIRRDDARRALAALLGRPRDEIDLDELRDEDRAYRRARAGAPSGAPRKVAQRIVDRLLASAR